MTIHYTVICPVCLPNQLHRQNRHAKSHAKRMPLLPGAARASLPSAFRPNSPPAPKPLPKTKAAPSAKSSARRCAPMSRSAFLHGSRKPAPMGRRVTRAATPKRISRDSFAKYALKSVRNRNNRENPAGQDDRRPRADDMLLECAERAHADLLITGDKDLLALTPHGRTAIVTLAEYLRI